MERRAGRAVIPAPACARVTDPESSSAPLDSRFHGNDEVKNGFTVVLNVGYFSSLSLSVTKSVEFTAKMAVMTGFWGLDPVL